MWRVPNIIIHIKSQWVNRLQHMGTLSDICMQFKSRRKFPIFHTFENRWDISVKIVCDSGKVICMLRFSAMQNNWNRDLWRFHSSSISCTRRVDVFAHDENYFWKINFNSLWTRSKLVQIGWVFGTRKCSICVQTQPQPIIIIFQTIEIRTHIPREIEYAALNV